MTTQTHTPSDVQGQTGPAAAAKATALKASAAKTPTMGAPAPASGIDGRGATTVADGVVAKIAGIAIQEIEGVHALGGGAARAVARTVAAAVRLHLSPHPVTVQVGIVQIGTAQTGTAQTGTN